MPDTALAMIPRIPRLIHSGARARRPVSTAGHAFIACVIGVMLLSVLGDVVDSALLAELEIDLLLTDIGFETLSSLGLSNWNLIELILAGAVLSLGGGEIGRAISTTSRALVSAIRKRNGKVPI